MTQDTVVVTQEDRETYADEVERFGDKEYAERIRVGQRDTLSMLSMLARHRAAAEQRGFKLCQDAAADMAKAYAAKARAAANDAGGRSVKVRNGFFAVSIAADEMERAIRTLSIKETGNGE